MSIAPAGVPLAADGARVAWLTSQTLSLLSVPLTPPPAPLPLTLAGMHGGSTEAPPPAAAPPPADVRQRRVEASAILKAVREAAEGGLQLGGYQGPTDGDAVEPLRCISAAMGRWHVAVMAAGVIGAGRWVSCIALVSHITGDVVRRCRGAGGGGPCVAHPCVIPEHMFSAHTLVDP